MLEFTKKKHYKEKYVETEVEDAEKSRISPERNLLTAVLERALLDLSDNQHRQDAMRWINKELTDSPEVMSFQYVCLQLDMDPVVIRKKVIESKGSFSSRPRRRTLT